VDRVYNYPLNPISLTGPPTFTQMTETWAGMDAGAPPARTTYAVNSDASPRTFETMYPDGTRVTELRYNHPGQFDDSLLYSQITLGAFSTNLLQKIDTTWSVEDYDSPCVKSTTVTNQFGQSATTTYDYYYDLHGVHSNNQILDIKEFDYGGAKVLRQTFFWYTSYPNHHIFNLPVLAATGDGTGNIVAETIYG
jgi:hypothetical protein